MDKATVIAYKRLPNVLVTRRNTPSSTIMGWLRCALELFPGQVIHNVCLWFQIML